MDNDTIMIQDGYKHKDDTYGHIQYIFDLIKIIVIEIQNLGFLVNIVDDMGISLDQLVDILEVKL